MAIFILLAFGILLLVFALVFRKRNIRGYHSMMKHNKNVLPLLKERSAEVKYDHLLEQFKKQPPALRELINLRNDYTNDVINAAQYESALNQLAAKYNGK